MSKQIIRAVSLIVLGVAAVLGSTQAVAVDQDLLKILRENGAITQKQFELLTEKKVASDASVISAVKDTQYKISTGKKGLSIKSTDGAYEFAVGGRAQVDGNFDFPNDSLGNGMEMRRARLKAYGKLDHDWKYKVEIDFSENKMSSSTGGAKDNKIGPTDAWVAYTGFDNMTLKAGYQKVPFSLQSETSSNWQTFQERAQIDAFIDTALLGRRRMGLTAAYSDDVFYSRAGAFSAGFNNDSQYNQSFGTAFRGLASLVSEKDKHLHVGGSVHYRNFEDNNNDKLYFKFHNESHVGGKAGNGQYWISTVSESADMEESSLLSFNAEVSGYMGPLHAEAEYTNVNVGRQDGNPDLNFDGFYGQVGYFLTGEHMNWKQSSGAFKRVSVRNSVGNGGIGSWEVAARYSHLDLTDGSFNGGKANNYTAGVNWWATNNVSLRLNYIYSDRIPSGGSNDTDLGETGAHALTMRTQVVF